MFDTSAINDLLAAYPKQSKRLAYGTAGFRDKHDLPLHSVFLRMGILAAVRSMSVGSKSIGVMITASHNPEEDNGIKIVDFDGGMLSQRWEPYAESLANAENDDFLDRINDVIRQESINTSNIPVVIVGRDTRWHSTQLSECVELGVVKIGGLCHNLGEVATPQLHYVVHQLNSTRSAPLSDFNATECLTDYYTAMSKGFLSLKRTSEPGSHCVREVVLDASNGVPSKELAAFQTILDGLLAGATDGVTLDLRNINGSGRVNEGCGAELVQKNQIPPANVSADKDAGKLLCSFDGDGDRIVFHYFSAEDRKWFLLDGDKIATLVTTLLFNELEAAGLDKQFKLGIVQTAYANGASTHYLRSRGIEVAIAKTGVKFVHHKALEYDIGVYFEANGHGTVLFSEGVTAAITGHHNRPGEDRKSLAFDRLKASLVLINQSVGDALSDMLLCLASLQVLNLTMYDWNALYTDYPSSQMKVKVPDKSRVSCSEDETTVLTPAALQEDLNHAMSTVNKGRCFVRPSGTEDVVRIYAEAATTEEAATLARLTKEAIEKHLC